jgi:DNA-binding response OmpR family regulator
MLNGAARAYACAMSADADQPVHSVLVIEDEPGIVDFVKRGLEAGGFNVRALTDGVAGERAALKGGFDALVLDLTLPGRDGMEILAAVRRAHPEIPVIVMTARGELEDRLAGLERGAVDYMVKPFAVAELAARIRAQLRARSETSERTLTGGDIEVDLVSRRVTRLGMEVQLSKTEFELLVFLLRHYGEVVAREQILSNVWRYEHDPATNVVDVYIGYLRRKLALPEHPAPIATVRAVGYRLGEP